MIVSTLLAVMSLVLMINSINAAISAMTRNNLLCFAADTFFAFLNLVSLVVNIVYIIIETVNA